MEYFKKYLNILFIMIFGFHSSFMMGSQFAYVPFSNSEVVETSRSIPEFFTENQTIVIASAAALLGCAALYVAKDKISGCAQKSYKNISEQVRKESFDAHKTVDQHISLKQRAMLFALRPLIENDLVEHIKNRPWRSAASAILILAGYIMGHPVPGGCLGGGSFVATYLNRHIQGVRSDVQKMDETNQRLHREACEENKRLHQEAGVKMDSIAQKADKLLEDLKETKSEILQQLGSSKDELTQEIETVGKAVIELSNKLDKVPEKIIDLKQELIAARGSLEKMKCVNDEVLQQNQKIQESVNALSVKLILICDKYTDATESLDSYQKTLTAQMKELTDASRKQMKEVVVKLGTQGDKLDDLKKEVDQQFQNSFGASEKQNQLLKSLEVAQDAHNAQLAKLLGKIKENKKRDLSTSELVQKLVIDEEKRAISYAEIVTSLQNVSEQNQETVNTFCTNMKTLEDKMNSRIDELEKAVSKNEESRQKDQSMILAKVDNTSQQVDLMKKMLKLQEDREESMYKQIKNLQKVIEEYKKELEEIKHDVKKSLVQGQENLDTSRRIEKTIKQYPAQQTSYPALMSASTLYQEQTSFITSINGFSSLDGGVSSSIEDSRIAPLKVKQLKGGQASVGQMLGDLTRRQGVQSMRLLGNTPK